MEITRNRVAVLLVLAVCAGILAVAVSAQEASAVCQGEGNPYFWSVGWADETVRGDTCDMEADYYGKFLDGAHDGYCVNMYTKDDPGSSWVYEGYNCSETIYKNYYFYYSDFFAYFKACKRGTSTCSSVGSTWGF